MKGVAMSGLYRISPAQVVLVLDQREQFSRNIGGRQHNRSDALAECSRQLTSMGIFVEAIDP